MTHTNYQPARQLDGYRSDLRRLADNLFRRVESKVTKGRASRLKGSYSILATSHPSHHVAKVFIYEVQRERSPLENKTVSVWVRVDGPVANKIWKGAIAKEYSDLFGRMSRKVTVGGVSTEHFAFLTIQADDDLDRLADFLAACSNL